MGLTAGIFRALSRARWPRVTGHRGARILHPDGVGIAARLDLTGTGHARGSLLSEREAYPAIVRLSRATGVPSALPDVLGIALRLVDARGEGEHQDLRPLDPFRGLRDAAYEGSQRGRLVGG